MDSSLHLLSARPLVRYVDKDQAVIDTHLRFVARPDQTPTPTNEVNCTVDLHIELSGSDGFFDEGSTRVPIKHGRAAVRFDVASPERWWPAGMGEQPLYDMAITFDGSDEKIDTRSFSLGLTSVRPDRTSTRRRKPSLLVNGRQCEIENVVPVDTFHENCLLPVTGTSLILVRDHYGPDLLYDAADRAGIMLIQAVPIDPRGNPIAQLKEQVARLSAHPSLVGYHVGNLGSLQQRAASRLHRLDPTRPVFDRFPLSRAA